MADAAQGSLAAAEQQGGLSRSALGTCGETTAV